MRANRFQFSLLGLLLVITFFGLVLGMVYYFAYIVIVSLATSGCWVLILVAILGWRGDPIETPAISGTPGVPGDPESDDGPS